MKNLPWILAFCLVVSCGAPTLTYNYQDWDADENKGIDQSEFVAAYVQNHAFKNWSSTPLLDSADFLNDIFTVTDSNVDNQISPYEFDTQLNKFYIATGHQKFKDWDGNNDATLHRDEFMSAIKQTNLLSLWDPSCDGRIDELEMANGMFYYADMNKNQRVDELEYNIWKVSRQSGGHGLKRH
jgi:hypothetical protein